MEKEKTELTPSLNIILNDYSDDQKASETIVDQATFRIIPLNSGDDITFGQDYPVKEDFPKHIVEKSISDNEPIFISNSRSETFSTWNNNPSNLNFCSLPDVYDHNEVFHDVTPKLADIYDVLDDTEEYHFGEHNLPENTDISADALSNTYKPEIIGHEEIYQSVHLQPQ